MTGMTPMADLKPIRIAMLSLHSSPIGPLGTQNTGGMSVYVRQVSKWLGAFGHTVDLFTCMPGPGKPVDLFPNVRLVHLDINNRQTIPKEKLFDHLPEAIQALERHARTDPRGYQMIHSHYWLSGVAGAELQKQWGCPHLLMFHTLGKVKNSTTTAESEPDRRICRERDLAVSSDAIVVPSQGERTNLTTAYGATAEKVKVVPCGVDLDRFRPMDENHLRRHLMIDDDAHLILYVGRFAPVKGLDTLLEAVASLAPRHPKVRLVMAGGDGPGADTTVSLIEHAEQLGISSHIVLAGRIDHQDLPRYYNAADLLVLPSTYESFGLVTLEAMACGTPVAATRTGGAPEIIRQGCNGTLIEHPDCAGVTKGLERLLREVRDEKFSTGQIRSSVAGYGWQRIAESIQKIYAALISQQ